MIFVYRKYVKLYASKKTFRLFVGRCKRKPRKRKMPFKFGAFVFEKCDALNDNYDNASVSICTFGYPIAWKKASKTLFAFSFDQIIYPTYPKLSNSKTVFNRRQFNKAKKKTWKLKFNMNILVVDIIYNDFDCKQV